MTRARGEPESAGPGDRAESTLQQASEDHEQELQALARSLRAKDFSQESRVKDSLRSWLAQNAAKLPQPAASGLRSLGGRGSRPRLRSGLVHRAAWGGLFLILLLAFAWNNSGVAPASGRPDQLVTAYLPAVDTAGKTRSTLAGGLDTLAPRWEATPGATGLAAVVWHPRQPALAPIPVPPSP